ncbi:FAD-dependent monooxygenase [Flavobacterium amniphilum]|uniref:FAD-dependent monooxygenase n=1 Tax=Flavobacterium amniphilum TaxID=1834035 RepID=UPI00202A7AF8|nr:FAD-dependent monooxygenase [Flavobacterium amniphilum]MCL9806202.1 FAD-dependent monooxygenase [Flavobacterium amniphilum]
MEEIYDVIIAGCGPTGATFANYLGKYNLKVLVFDIEPDIVEYPRAVHIDEDVIRIFQELGLYGSMLEDAIKPFENYALVSKRDKTLFQFQPDSSVSENIPDCNWILQPGIEKHLRNGFAKYSNVTFMKETSWIKLSQTSDRVSLVLKNNKNEEVRVKSKFLIACDGGKSPIRKKLNISVYDFGFKKEWFVIDTNYHGDEIFSEDHKQFCDPKQPITYVNGVDKHFRWEFMVSEKDSNLSDEMLAVKMIPKLNALFPIDDFEIIRKKKYTFYTLLANSWRSGNIFLAGDAAHQMPPFLGQGMCSGIKDAKNLSWKLALACRNNNSSTENLLDSYQAERAPQVKKIIKLAAILGGFIQYSNPVLSPFRNGLLKMFNVLPNKPIDALINKHLYGIEIDNFSKLKHSLVGKRIPQPKVISVNGELYFDEVCGFNWVVLYRADSKMIPYSSFSLLKFIGVDSNPSKFFNRIQSEFFIGWMNRHKVDFVIIRPDKFIFNTGNVNQYDEILNQINSYLEKIHSN